MTLEIVTRTYAKRDLVKRGPTLLLYIPYAPVYQGGYGRVDMSSSVNGLATYNTADCTAVVIHSPHTKRTVLTHSPILMIMNLTFRPIVEWVIAKYEQEYNSKSQIEVVIMRGYQYRVQNTDAYPVWVRDFKNMLSHFSTHPNNVFDDQPLEKSSMGTLFVDKGTGKITRVKISEPVPIIEVVNTGMSQVHSTLQKNRDMYVGAVIINILQAKIEDLPSLYLQFDIDKYMPAIPMPDSARLIIREKRSLKQDTGEMMANCGLPHWINPIMIPMMNTMLAMVDRLGLPCERCGKPGDKKCLGCLGAWYCSKDHQREDWDCHKRFCKANKIK